MACSFIMQIPFSPPFIDDSIIEEVTDALRSGWITTGPKVKALEETIASFCGVEHALAVNSATSAIMLALHWFGVSRGDEVIVPAYTYCATALAVIHIGATPVMVDVLQDFTINALEIKKAITPKTKAIITVDFGGWPCDYDAIYEIVKEDGINELFKPNTEAQGKLNRILILSDAAHSLGAVYKNKNSGALADISIFSFHAVKNATTAEGGIITFCMPEPFNNKSIYDTLRLWSLNGQTKDAYTKSVAGGWKYDIVYPGFKMNLPDVLAAIGLAQMRKYDSYLLPARKNIFEHYINAFQGTAWAIVPPFKKEGYRSSYHLFPLRIKDINEAQRDKIINLITAKGVSVNVHFIPMPMLTVFKEMGFKIENYPVAFELYKNEISLPLYPQLTAEERNYVVKIVSESVIEVINA